MRASAPQLRLLAAIAIAALAGCSRAAAPEVAAACDALPAPDPAVERPIDPESVDQWLLSEAVLSEVNQVRCARGLKPLRQDAALDRAAAYHSGDMVRRGFLGHESPVSGRRTPRDRVEQVGARYARIAENLARIGVHAFDGREFFIRDRANCVFSFAPGGPPIPRRSYAGAAERLVAGWIDSRGHRRNILDPEMTRHGAGAAVRPDPAICGELLVTQLFGG